jgi:tetratricopeptide (TPR) repeat protein
MPLDSLNAELHVIQGLLSENRFIDASAHCAALVKAFPQDPRAWSVAADAALRAGQPLDAAKFLRHAVDCAPNDATLLIRHGQCLLQLGRRREAMDAATRAQRTDPPGAPYMDALGALLTHLEEPMQALPYFQRAVQLAPENIDYRYNLAMAQRMAGDLLQSEANLDVVIAARPNDGASQHARSNLRRQTPAQNHVQQLEQALQRLRGRRASVPVAFALAKELEDLGEYSRAFGILQAASQAYRTALRYDVAEDVAVLDKLRMTQTKAALDRLQGSFDSDECIFVVGLPRSGTTLVERILGSHSQVYSAGELDAFPKVAIEAVGRSGKPAATKLEFAERLLDVDFARLGPDYLAATRPRTGHTRKFTDKLPMNYLYAGAIHAALPKARFVAVQRQPMDSCYAMYKTLFAAAYPFTYDLNDLARYFVAWQRLMAHWKDVIGDAWLEVNYEDLVADQEAVSRRIVTHCGLDWELNCLQFHSQAGGVTTASAAQVRMPLYADSVGKWRHYGEQLRPLAALFKSNGIDVR